MYEGGAALKEEGTAETVLLGSSRATFSPDAFAMLRCDKKTHRANGTGVFGINIAGKMKVFWCVVYDGNGNGKMSQEATLTVLLRDETVDIPQMGDDWPLETLIALALCALAALVGYTVYRRTRGAPKRP